MIQAYAVTSGGLLIAVDTEDQTSLMNSLLAAGVEAAVIGEVVAEHPGEIEGNLMADYDPEMHKEEMIEAYERIRQRIHTPIALGRIAQAANIAAFCVYIFSNRSSYSYHL